MDVILADQLFHILLPRLLLLSVLQTTTGWNWKLWSVEPHTAIYQGVPPKSQCGAIFCHLNDHCAVFKNARKWQKKEKDKKAISPFLDTSGNQNIGATICIGQEIWCLPYEGFKKKKKKIGKVLVSATLEKSKYRLPRFLGQKNWVVSWISIYLFSCLAFLLSSFPPPLCPPLISPSLSASTKSKLQQNLVGFSFSLSVAQYWGN